MRLTISVIVLALLPANWALAITTTNTSFQKDVNGYTDILEMRISQPGAAARDGTLGSAVSNYLIDGWETDDPLTEPIEADSPDEQELIRFGSIFGSNLAAGQIPYGATILDAQLTYKTFDTGTTPPSGGPWGVAGLNQAFTTATRYADFPSSNGNPLLPSRGAWFQDGQDQVGHPYATRPVGAFAGPNSAGPPPTGTNTLGGVTNADVWPLVQRWSNDPTGANNYGMVVQAGWTGPTNGWGFHTIGSPTVANRPKLSVTYTTSPIGITTIQRGTNGYADDVVARLDSGATAGIGDDVTTDGSGVTSALYIDGATGNGGVFASLMKFPNAFGANVGQAPAGKAVVKAWLVLTTGTSNDHRSPGPFSVHKMLRDWDLDSVDTAKPTLYTEFGATPGFQEADGDMGPTLDINYGATNGSESWFDVTSYLDAVRTSGQDFGLAIVPETTDGWAIMQNGATDASVRPRLVIYSDLSAAGVPGDYNNDNKVDSADYVSIRKQFSSITSGDGLTAYNTWRQNFGTGAGSGLGGAGVPEPATWLIGLVACAIVSSLRTRKS